MKNVKFPIKSAVLFLITLTLLAVSPIASVAVPTFVGLSALDLLMPKGLVLGVINPAQLTWNGKEIRELNEAIFESVFINPSINDFHTIVTDVKAKQQIAFLGLMGLVGKKGKGCDPNADTASIPMSEKFWLPESIQLRLEECWTTYNETFFVWAQNNGIKRADITDTDIFKFVEERTKTAIDEAVLRHAWFGDTDAAFTTDSPAGLIYPGAGVSLDHFNAIDGFWKQIYAIVAADSDRKASTITKNSGGTFALQKFDSTDTTNKVVHGYLQDALDNADTRLSDREDKIFIVTKSIYNQYKRELKSYTNIEASFEIVQNGKKELMFDGVPVRPFTFWDRMIEAYIQDGTKAYQPHRILLTVKANTQIGAEGSDTLGQFESFYDKKSKDNILDAQWLMDAKVAEDYMIQVAY